MKTRYFFSFFKGESWALKENIEPPRENIQVETKNLFIFPFGALSFLYPPPPPTPTHKTIETRYAKRLELKMRIHITNKK